MTRGAANPADFRALARSSPYLWRSVRLVRRLLPRDDEGVRAWIRRPQAIRVEQLDGRLLQAGPGRKDPSHVAWLTTAGGKGPSGSVPDRPRWWTDPLAEQPVLDERGLVVRRADLAVYDDAMYVDYRWVAMLDPLELADGVAVSRVTDVDHHGRAAWEAVVQPVDGYQPRCECCALLPSAQADALDADARGIPPEPPPRGGYADAHRIRLDTGTGICVLAEEIGGGAAGTGFEVTIEEVDQPYPDQLFPEAVMKTPIPEGSHSRSWQVAATAVIMARRRWTRAPRRGRRNRRQ